MHLKNKKIGKKKKKVIERTMPYRVKIKPIKQYKDGKLSKIFETLRRVRETERELIRPNQTKPVIEFKHRQRNISKKPRNPKFARNSKFELKEKKD